MLNLLSVLLPIALVAVVFLHSLSVVGDQELVIPQRWLDDLCRQAADFQKRHCREEAPLSTEEQSVSLEKLQRMLAASSLPRLPTPVPHVQHTVG